jgi:hypothetical protein
MDERLQFVARRLAGERATRLVAKSDVDAYLLDPHRFYPLKVNTGLRLVSREQPNM